MRRRTKTHYEKLHPHEMSFENRMRCLRALKAIGFQTGCGFMVGSPCQTARTLATDLKFIEAFQPDMCGVGPFIPHHATPFRDFPAGSAEQTLYLLSLIRLIRPNILLPATTALGTVEPGRSRKRAVRAGANVIMPNLSPLRRAEQVRALRQQAGHGQGIGAESGAAQGVACDAIGYRVVTARGDVKKP